MKFPEPDPKLMPPGARLLACECGCTDFDPTWTMRYYFSPLVAEGKNTMALTGQTTTCQDCGKEFDLEAACKAEKKKALDLQNKERAVPR